MKRTKRKLSVSKETLRKLSKRELGDARGGGSDYCGPNRDRWGHGNNLNRAGDTGCCNRA